MGTHSLALVIATEHKAIRWNEGTAWAVGYVDLGIPKSAVGTQISSNSLSQHHGGRLMAPTFPTPSLPSQPPGRVISFLKLKIHFVL